ncbi:unnamed protein product [Gongylonema pulchrum]|uniref:Secreted protein n=1 Tax=Gongylonema pulchrum TaxID=637853 RepID=A0A183DC72_9BILA|nr:unnamed protein product [Gongylonema pulchrum]
MCHRACCVLCYLTHSLQSLGCWYYHDNLDINEHRTHRLPWISRYQVESDLCLTIITAVGTGVEFTAHILLVFVSSLGTRENRMAASIALYDDDDNDAAEAISKGSEESCEVAQGSQW